MLAKLPANIQAGFQGYNGTILPSFWSNWKPTHPAPYVVGLLMQPLNNDYSVSMAGNIQSNLKASPLIKTVLFSTHATGAEDIQEYDSLVQQHVDLIIDQPYSAPALLPSITAAAMQGIPTVLSDASENSQYTR